MMRLVLMVLQLLSIMQHNTDVSLHLCFLCAAKVHSLLKQCLFLLSSLSSVLGQEGYSNPDNLKDSTSANHLWRGNF